MDNRERLGSRLGFIMLSAGCAIGCGNVWKFPWMCGQFGGGGFVVVYILCLLLLGLPVLVMEDSGTLKIDVYWQPKVLEVYEEYYHSLSSGATRIESGTRTAVWDGDGYTLEITRKNANKPEQAIYYITDGEDKYIFKVVFPAESTEEAVVTG